MQWPPSPVGSLDTRCFSCHTVASTVTFIMILLWIKCCYWVSGSPASVVFSIFLKLQMKQWMKCFVTLRTRRAAFPKKSAKTNDAGPFAFIGCQIPPIMIHEIVEYTLAVNLFSWISDWLVFMSVSWLLRSVNFLPILLFYEIKEMFCLWKAQLTLLLLKCEQLLSSLLLSRLGSGILESDWWLRLFSAAL